MGAPPIRGRHPRHTHTHPDNYPIVLSHARALLTSTPEGACSYIDAGIRDTAKILAEVWRSRTRPATWTRR